jgi:predicted O-methyltransferase YrrM
LTRIGFDRRDRLATSTAAVLNRLHGVSARSVQTEVRVSSAFRHDGEQDYYGGVLTGATTIGSLALDPAVHTDAWHTLERLHADDYMAYVRTYVAAGRDAAGESWRYADVVTVLAAATRLLRPSSYLEIGVRRGRSMAIVAAGATTCSILGIDLWQIGYASIENPGPDHVRQELQRVGHTGELDLLTGDSHKVLPRVFAERPDVTFDLILVDGDHSARGAGRDLRAVLPRLRIGGALVFDDIRHPSHPGLFGVWQRTVVTDRRYSTWEFDDVGYGVAVAVRRW